jgi:hypothetical protein
LPPLSTTKTPKLDPAVELLLPLRLSLLLLLLLLQSLLLSVCAY